MGDNRIEVMEMIRVETEKDVKNFEGRPFTGKVVAEYFGYQAAAIVALADNVKSILEQLQESE